MEALQDSGFYVSIDVALIIAALAPTLTILATAWVQGRRRRGDRKQLDGIHTLVNDQMTREKEARLSDLRAQKIVLERLMKGDGMSKADRAILDEMDRQIGVLEREVRRRDESAFDVRAYGSKS